MIDQVKRTESVEDPAQPSMTPRTGTKSVLVSGSTGLVGSALVKRLSAGGLETTRLVRSLPRTGEVHWDPKEGTFDTASVSADAVVHLAGENIADGRWTSEKMHAIRSSRVLGTRLLSQGLAGMKTPPRVLVSASAIGFYGDRGGEILSEGSASGSGFLSEVCEDWERATAPAREAGIRVVNLRIGMVLDRDGGALAKMLLPFKLGLGGKLGAGDQYMSWITSDDLVSVLCHAIEDEGLEGPVNATAPQPVTNLEFTKTLGAVLRRPTIAPMPAFVARLAFGRMADALLLASARVVPEKLKASGFTFEHPELMGALKSLLRPEPMTLAVQERPGFVLEREQRVRRDLREVFAFFADPLNLEALTPPWLRFRVLGSSTPALGPGTTIDYKLRLRGFPVRWTSLISYWDPPFGFTDEQLAGPYRSWVHQHSFRPTPDGVLMRDRIDYAVPGGALVERLLVRRDLEKIFDYREERLATLLPDR